MKTLTIILLFLSLNVSAQTDSCLNERENNLLALNGFNYAFTASVTMISQSRGVKVPNEFYLFTGAIHTYSIIDLFITKRKRNKLTKKKSD